MTSKCSVFCAYLLFFINFVKAPLPSILPVCIRDDPQLPSCIARTIYALRSRFTTGDLGDGIRIQRLDPLYIPRITYGKEHTLQTRMMDIYMKGFSNFKIDNLYVNIKDLMFDMNVTVPRIDIKANYKMIFGYFGAPIYSEGHIIQILGNTKLRVIIKGNLHFINGKRYLNFDPFFFKVTETSTKYINFTNFFLNTVLVGPIVKQYLTDNIGYFNERILPDFEKSFSEIFTRVANQIALSASFDEIFPI